jgi:hypothetical protein
MDLAELPARFESSSLHSRAVRHVELYRVHCAEFPKDRQSIPQMISSAVGYSHLRPLLEQSLGQSQTNPAYASRDDRNLATQLFHVLRFVSQWIKRML